ncbi:MAG: alpha/beta hydrolase [Bdellovibrionota bacterium]
MSLQSALPFEGELTPAPHRKFKETIVFVHHFGGSKRLLKRHLEFVNELGFDAIRFSVSPNEKLPKSLLPNKGGLKFGARHAWADQVETILNHVPGKKIIYSFSMPSNGALEAIARRKAEDVSAWVCDGGPFAQILRCTWNLLTHEQKVENRFLRGIASGFAYLFFGLRLKAELKALAREIPKDFPVLSIRGEKDPLVPVSAIVDIFEELPQLDLEVLILAEGVHLDGLKNDPELYKPAVERFLSRSATLI